MKYAVLFLLVAGIAAGQAVWTNRYCTNFGRYSVCDTFSAETEHIPIRALIEEKN